MDKYVQNIINKTPDNILAVKIFDDDSWEACGKESFIFYSIDNNQMMNQFPVL